MSHLLISVNLFPGSNWRLDQLDQRTQDMSGRFSGLEEKVEALAGIVNKLDDLLRIRKVRESRLKPVKY